MKAGVRPKTRSAKGLGFMRFVRTARRRVVFVVTILGLAFAGIVAVYPPARQFVVSNAQAIKNTVVGWLPSPDSPIRPAAVTATVESAGHGGGMAFDIATNTYWAATWDPHARPKLTVNLGSTTVLTKVIVTSGAAERYASYHRPLRLFFTYSNGRNEGISLADKPEVQTYELNAGVGVESLTIEILDVAVAEKATELAITEIELFGVG